jgi:hypothetical protein
MPRVHGLRNVAQNSVDGSSLYALTHSSIARMVNSHLGVLRTQAVGPMCKGEAVSFHGQHHTKGQIHLFTYCVSSTTCQNLEESRLF